MEKITFIFEEDPFNLGNPLPSFDKDYRMCCASDSKVLLLDYDALISGDAFLPKAAKRDTPTLLRCRPVSEDKYKVIKKKLLSSSYRLIEDNEWFIYHNPGFYRKCKGLSTDKYMIKCINSGASFGYSGYDPKDPLRYLDLKPNGDYDDSEKEERIKRAIEFDVASLHANKYEPPTVFYARDEDYPLYDDKECRAVGSVTSSESEEIAQRFRKKKDDRIVGDVFFETSFEYAKYDSVDVRWRVFYCGEVPFCSIPLLGDNLDKPKGFPEVPFEAIEAFSLTLQNCFYSVDFGMVEGGLWKCTRVLDGQFGALPSNAPDDFYRQLVTALTDSPKLPEWIWCLTGTVVDENKSGETSELVHGTRHFAPGTKLYLNIPHWDSRVAVVGIPRYSSKYTRLVMDIEKIENFAVEKVHDKKIIAGILEPRLSWPFLDYKEDEVTRYTWNDYEDPYKRIMECIEWLNEEKD